MSDSNRFGLADGLDLAGIDVDELWWRYTANGGQADLETLAAHVAGTAQCDDAEHDLIAQTLNECFIDRGLDTFPVGYVQPFDGTPASTAEQHRALREEPLVENPLRRRAMDARRRSTLAALHAAALHETSARALERSGAIQYARHAYERAASALARAGLTSELRHR